jgi:hypothetical protein
MLLTSYYATGFRDGLSYTAIIIESEDAKPSEAVCGLQASGPSDGLRQLQGCRSFGYSLVWAYFEYV